MSHTAVNPRRTLQLKVVEARGLIACSLKNNTSDPFVVAFFTDRFGREIKAERFTTDRKNATLDPKWDQSFVFGACGFMIRSIYELAYPRCSLFLFLSAD